MANTYTTLLDESYSLQHLPKRDQAIALQLIERAKANPDWNEFSNWAREACQPAFAELAPKQIPESPLYRIAQDLEMRLGVKQGKARLPDYRDKLEYLIRKTYPSIAAFCREVQVDQAYLSHLFGKDRDASMKKLLSMLDKLGYRLQFTKKDPQPISDF